jgi:hypothetical protein
MPERRARAAFHADAAARKEISETRAGAHFGATQHLLSGAATSASLAHLTVAVSCFDI